MEDKELLEAAAKVGEPGQPWKWHESGMMCLYNEKMRCWYKDENHDRIEWDPLRDDGDALRLAVKLELFDLDRLLVDLDIEDAKTATNRDPYEATRRAIVLAASKVAALPSNALAQADSACGVSPGATGSTTTGRE